MNSTLFSYCSPRASGEPIKVIQMESMESKVTNYRAIFRILGIIILIIGIAELFPWAYAEISGDGEVAFAFRICAPVTLALGAAMFWLIKTGRSRFGAREGYLS